MINLFRKDPREIGKGLKFQCVAARIKKKHCRLLADLALKTGFWLDDKFHAFSGEFVSESTPFVDRQDYAEMRHRDAIGVNLICGLDAR